MIPKDRGGGGVPINWQSLPTSRERNRPEFVGGFLTQDTRLAPLTLRRQSLLYQFLDAIEHLVLAHIRRVEHQRIFGGH
jgi:hypothetical protein